MSAHDATGNGLSRRLDSIERRIDGLRDELTEVRALARAVAHEAEAAEPAPVAVDQPSVWPPPSLRPAARPPLAPPPAATAPARASAQPAAPPAKTRATAGELVERWQLLGPRGFAIVGGAVTALGIGLLFVLAANRGGSARQSASSSARSRRPSSSAPGTPSGRGTGSCSPPSRPSAPAQRARTPRSRRRPHATTSCPTRSPCLSRASSPR